MSTATRADGPVYDIDLMDPEINRDPYPYLTELREEAPVGYNPQTGWWIATSFADAKAVLGGETSFGPQRELYDNLFGARVFEAMDQPRHDEVRGIWKPHFLRAALDAHAAAVEQIVDQLLDDVMPRLQDGEAVDMMPDFLLLLPAYVVALIVGAPREDFVLFKGWNEAIGRVNEAHSSDDSDWAQGVRAEAANANTAMRGYFADAIDARRRERIESDMVGVMAHSEVELDEEQRRAHLVQLLWAGSDTTTKHLAHTMVTLARHPDQRRMIAADRTLVPQALEESLRFEAVAGTMPRRARVDIELGGVTIQEGEIAVGHIAAANRDPARWDDADSFDITRPAKAHLGYGTGIHSCLGVQLARLEGRIWLDRVLDRMPDWELATDDIDYGINILSRGPKNVPVALC